MKIPSVSLFLKIEIDSLFLIKKGKSFQAQEALGMNEYKRESVLEKIDFKVSSVFLRSYGE